MFHLQDGEADVLHVTIPSLRRAACASLRAPARTGALLLWALLIPGACARETGSGASAGPFDLVIRNGRVVDPASGLDAIRNVGITDGRVAAVTEADIRGEETIDATGLVVAPGFIDLHVHGQTNENYRLQAQDGVTSSLELEVGTADVPAWYAEREGSSIVNYGVSVGHIPVRMAVMGELDTFLPRADAAHREATDEEIGQITRRVEEGLRAGAVAVGMGLQNTPAASRWEALEVFRVASRHEASVHVHLRYMGLREPTNSIAATEEVIADAAISGAPLHIVHIHSSGLNATRRLLDMVGEAREQGLDVTTEVYPYTAGMTGIESAVFDEGWQDVLGISYRDLEWAATGERLTPDTFRRYRRQGGFVILHFVPEEAMRAAVESPLTMIVSDGGIEDGRGHPRSSGTYARILDDFVRGARTVELSQAIRKMSLMPAERLKARVPDMARKGRVQVGADADLVVFDLDSVQDRATYAEPAVPSEGFRWVLVNGVPVVRDGVFQEGVHPGRPVRAPVEGGGG